jgi:hypothetical protein
MMWNAQIEKWFTYHSPNEDQKRRYEMVRLKAKEFAHIIVRSCPDSADRTAALRMLRECVMTANASIALEENEKK